MRRHASIQLSTAWQVQQLRGYIGKVPDGGGGGDFNATLRRIAPLLLHAAVQPAYAQRTRVTGTVVDSASGTPLEGVQVRLIDMDISTSTDSDGSFQFFGIASGTHTLAARRLGYEPMAIRFELNAANTRQADLGVLRIASRAIELDPLVVEAEFVLDFPQMEGFFRRMRAEQGTCLTEADIEKEAPPETSDLLRKVPGFRTDQFGRLTSGRGSGGFRANCPVQVYVNGVKVNAPTVNVVQPATIIGMELYTGSSTVPTIFRSQSNASCGVVAIWTRHTRRN